MMTESVAAKSGQQESTASQSSGVSIHIRGHGTWSFKGEGVVITSQSEVLTGLLIWQRCTSRLNLSLMVCFRGCSHHPSSESRPLIGPRCSSRDLIDPVGGGDLRPPSPSSGKMEGIVYQRRCHE